MLVRAVLAEDPTGCGSTCETLLPSASIFDVRDYGAVGDGRTMDTLAIQKAMNAAGSSGGGAQVVLRNGTFLTGLVYLRSNTFLRVDGDGILLGSNRPEDYPQNDTANWRVVLLDGVQNAGILGGGILDGNALPGFLSEYRRDYDQLMPRTWTGPAHGGCEGECRPRLLQIRNSRRVVVRDVVLRNSPDWTFHLFNSSSALVDNVTVFGDERWPNNDGIDVDSSQDVTVRQSVLETGDDAICLKSTLGGMDLFNVLIRDNAARSRSSAVKFGSATQVDMHHILIDGLQVLGGTNRALGIQHRDGGNLSDIEFRNVQIDQTTMYPARWWGASEPIWVSSVPRSLSLPVGRVSDVRFVNVRSRAAVNGALLSSTTPFPLENITMANVSLTLVPPSGIRRPGGIYWPLGHDYRPSLPGHPGLVATAQNGVFLEHALGTVLDGVTLSFDALAGNGPSVPPGWTPSGNWSTCVAGTDDSMASLREKDVDCHAPHVGGVEYHDVQK